MKVKTKTFRRTGGQNIQSIPKTKKSRLVYLPDKKPRLIQMTYPYPTINNEDGLC